MQHYKTWTCLFYCILLGSLISDMKTVAHYFEKSLWPITVALPLCHTKDLFSSVSSVNGAPISPSVRTGHFGSREVLILPSVRQSGSKAPVQLSISHAELDTWATHWHMAYKGKDRPIHTRSHSHRPTGTSFLPLCACVCRCIKWKHLVKWLTGVRRLCKIYALTLTWICMTAVVCVCVSECLSLRSLCVCVCVTCPSS